MEIGGEGWNLSIPQVPEADRGVGNKDVYVWRLSCLQSSGELGGEEKWAGMGWDSILYAQIIVRKSEVCR